MLTVVIPASDGWDPKKNEFVPVGKAVTLKLEHSLLSLSKWESKWHVPFLDEKNEKTPEQMMDYIKCMTLTQNVDDEVYKRLSPENMNAINTYINDPATATWFSDNKPDVPKGRKPKWARNSKPMTAELIYFAMINYQIPVEFQKWHLNRLLTLIRVCQEKNAPPKKMSKKAAMSQQRMLNEARRAQYHTNG